jgi:transglutaminase-like putative cysteine protease
MKKTGATGLLIFFIFLFPTVSSATYKDLLAADQKAATYRTGEIDPLLLAVPPELSGAGDDMGRFAQKLVDWLCSSTTDPYLKIKRIHDWITSTVGYDFDAYYGFSKGDSTPLGVLKNGKGTCGGYAALFKKFADLAGFETIIIPGSSRRSINLGRGTMADHIWNGVKINGTWYIVDTTHDNRFGVRDKKKSAKKAYRDTQLFIAPDAKAIENIPFNPEHAFTPTALAKDDFLQKPYISFSFLRYGLSFAEFPREAVVREQVIDPGRKTAELHERVYLSDSTVRFAIRNGGTVAIYARIKDENGATYNEHAIARHEKGNTICEFSAPRKGKFTAYISAQHLDPRERLAHPVYTFELIGTGVSGPKLPLNDQLYTLPLSRLYQTEIKELPHRGTLGERIFEVWHPESVTVSGGVYLDGREAYVQRGKTTAGTAGAIPGRKVSLISIPNTELTDYLVKIKAKPAAQKLYSDTIAIERITTGDKR